MKSLYADKGCLRPFCCGLRRCDFIAHRFALHGWGSWLGSALLKQMESPMTMVKFFSLLLSGAILSGCCSTRPLNGPNGPELVSSGYATESGSYAEIGVRFTNTGDFFALFSPSRWRSPVETGGSLSWLNPVAWSEDAGRTGRILLGEAAVVGGAVAGYAMGNDSSSSVSDSETISPPPPPAPPPGP